MHCVRRAWVSWDFQCISVPSEDMETFQLTHAIRLRHAHSQGSERSFVTAGRTAQHSISYGNSTCDQPWEECPKLCDLVRPGPVHDLVALQLLCEELQCEDLETIVQDLQLEASASLATGSPP